MKRNRLLKINQGRMRKIESSIKIFLSYLLVISFLLSSIPAAAFAMVGDGEVQIEPLTEPQAEPQIIWNEPAFTSGFTDANATGFKQGWNTGNLPITSITEGEFPYFYILPINAGNRYHDARGMFTGYDVAETTFYLRPGYAQPSTGFHRIFFEDRTPASNFLGIRAVPLAESGKVRLEWQRYNGAYATIPGCDNMDALEWYRIVFTFDYVKNTITIKIGDLVTLNAGTADNRKPEWPIIDMVGCFQTTVDNAFAIREYTVRTGDYQKPDPTSVVLSSNHLALSCGTGSEPSNRAASLSATVEPAQARQDISWTSSNPAVAKVSPTGVVTAVGEGTATIRANSVKEDVYAECEVHVTNRAGTLTPLYDNLTTQFTADFTSLATTGFDAGNAGRNVDNGYLAINGWGSGGRSSFHDYNSGSIDIAEYRFGWMPGYAMPRENWYEIFFESLSPSTAPVFAIRQVSTDTPGVVNLQYWVDDGRVGRSSNAATWEPVPGFQGVRADVWYELVVTFNYLTRELWLQVDDYRTDVLRFSGKRVGRTQLNGWRVSNWGDTDKNHIALGVNKYTVSIGEYNGPRPDPESVILSQTSAELSFGPGAIPGYNDSIQLTTVVEPSHALPDITWTSSDSTLVTVDENGFVKAVALENEDNGKIVTITATGTNSTGAPTTAYAECFVTIVYKEYVPQPYVPDFGEYLPEYRSVFGTDFRYEDGTWLFEGVNHKSVIESIDGEDILNFYLHYEENNSSGSRSRIVSFDPVLNRNLGPNAYIYFDWNPGGHSPLEIRLRNGDSQILTLRSLGGTNGVAAYTGAEASGWDVAAPTMIVPSGKSTSAWYSFGIDFNFTNHTVTITVWERGKAFVSTPLGSILFNLTDSQNQINRMELLNIRAGSNYYSTTRLDNMFALRKKETDDTITKITVWHDPSRWPDKQLTSEGNFLSARQYCVIPIGEDWQDYLPEQVLCQLENGDSVYVNVTWQQPEYHNNGVKEDEYKFSKDKPGLYTFQGILAEESGFAINSKKIPLEAYVEYRIESDLTRTNQLERSGEWLDRGVVALPVADRSGPLKEQANGLSGILVTWRMLSSEYNTGLTFNVYRNGIKINAAPISTLNYIDADGQSGDGYKVEAVPLPGRTTDGEIMSKEVTAWNSPAADNGPFPYLDIQLQKPKDRPCIANGIGCPSDCVVTYSINDCSAADVDGDGQYEILVQWLTHGRDSSHVGYMAESIFDCYTLEGKLLWRINRGYNIGSGAHYPTLHFYDLDEDGKAEFAMKTGVGTRMFFPKEDGTIDDTTDIPAWVLRTVDDNRSSGKQWTDLGGDKYSSIDIPYAEPIWVPGTAEDINNDPRNANWPIYINGFFGSGPLWQGGGGEYNGTDPAYPAGKILQSPEFISVFDGLTGAPKENGTLPYFAPFDLYGPYWGDGYGNRGDRFLGAVAYLPKNGVPGAAPYPSIVEVRGQYGPGDVGAYQWVDGELKLIWHYTVVSPDREDYKGTSHGGNHNMSVADVDFDGYDEILTGATAINEDGRILWAADDQNGHPLAGHGDAIHVSVMQPDSNEFYIVLPQEGPPRYGAVALNGSNGELIWGQGSGDTGRGAAFNISPLPGFEVWASGIAIYNLENGQYLRDGFYTNDSVWAENPIPNAISVNSGIYWDGDLSRELLDHWSGRPHITKFIYNEANPAASRVEGWWRMDGTSMNNGSKSNPSLTLDLYGDWREELLVRRNDENALRIFSSNIPTDNVIYTLMHDPTYRQGVSWQNGGYNQPPHLGFYLGEDIADQVAAMELPVPSLRYTRVSAIGAEINPKIASFDKNESSRADVVTSITWNDSTAITDILLTGVSIGDYAYAVSGSAIAVSGSVLSIKKEFLLTQPEGILEFKVIFDKGDSATLHIEIVDTSLDISAVIEPQYGCFDKKIGFQADVISEITWNDASRVVDITKKGLSIGANAYTVSGSALTVSGSAITVSGSAIAVSGSSLVIKKDFLATQPIGKLTLVIEFDKGNPATLEITIFDSSIEPVIVSATIQPNQASFDKYAARSADVKTSIVWNDAASVTDVKHIGTSIGAEAYYVVGNQLTIKKEYLATLNVGTYRYHVEFNLGNVAELIVSVADTTPSLPPVIITPTPIPTPAAPTPAAPTPDPTPSTSPKRTGKVNLDGVTTPAEVIIYAPDQEGELKVMIHLPMADILTLIEEYSSNENPLALAIPVVSKEMTKEFIADDVSSAGVTIVIPSTLKNNKKVQLDIKIPKNFIKVAKESKKGVSVSVVDEMGNVSFTWNFTGDDLANSKKKISEVNLNLEVGTFDSYKELNEIAEDGLFLHFSHEGILPAQAAVRIYVGNQDGMESGDRVYLYHFNPKTKKLETLPYSSSYRVDEDGYINIHILHCSNYVILKEKADNSVITALKNQISIKPKVKTLYVGGTKGSTTSIQVELPATLELVESIEDTTSGSAVGAVTITYKSNNPKVATVDNNGKVTAKRMGTALITTTVKLYSGKTITGKTSITVKEPYIKLIKSTSTLKVGDSYTFEANAYGLDLKDATWTTLAKSVIVINKSTGKAIAKSKGTDYVVVTIGNVTSKVKVIVS